MIFVKNAQGGDPWHSYLYIQSQKYQQYFTNCQETIQGNKFHGRTNITKHPSPNFIDKRKDDIDELEVSKQKCWRALQ